MKRRRPPAWFLSSGLQGGELDVLHLQLDVAAAVELVEGGLDREIDGGAGLEVGVHRAVAEGDALERVVALANEDLEVVAGLADAARGGGDLEVAAAEQRA